MTLNRNAIAEWLHEQYGDGLETRQTVEEEPSQEWLQAADAFALRFKLPLDADSPGITRCRCGHPVGEHKEGENACTGKVIGRRGTEPCNCQKAVARAK